MTWSPSGDARADAAWLVDQLPPGSWRRDEAAAVAWWEACKKAVTAELDATGDRAEHTLSAVVLGLEKVHVSWPRRRRPDAVTAALTAVALELGERDSAVRERARSGS